MSLLPNPSHLGTSLYPACNLLNTDFCFVQTEAINPVALGLARAKQYSLLQSPEYLKNDFTCMLGDKVMCVQIHGDASFAGQGIIMESLGLSMYKTYFFSQVQIDCSLTE